MENRKNYCILARYHDGDENGQSAVRFVKPVLSQDAKDAGFVDVWLEYSRQEIQKESDSDVKCMVSPAEVFTGRAHSGDENGDTTYTAYRVAAKKISPDGSLQRCEGVLTEQESSTGKESTSGWVEAKDKVLVGRTHKGDENADTTTVFAKICLKDGDSLYELELEDATETEACRESRSDFYMDEAGENPDWMKQMEDGIKLKELVLPASHDAGMSELHHMSILTPKAAVQTQGSNIYQQLGHGSRYFDIRVDYDHEELVTYHRTGNFGGNGQTLEDVFRQAEAFLREYPSETFIMKISHIRHGSKDTAERIKEFLKGFRDSLYCSDESKMLHELTLGELRGRMLAVCQWTDFAPDTQNGLFCYSDADDGETGAGYDTLNVYDHYSDTGHYDKMEKDQTEKWKDHAGAPGDMLFLLSWTLTQTTGSIKRGAEEANGHLEAVLDEKIVKNGWQAPALVYVDFISAGLCSTVLQYNFL